MKAVALLRHAKSSWDDPALADFDRPLNRRGIEAARLMGAEIRRRALKFDFVLASPATRVAETIEHLERSLGESLEPRFVPGIYHAAPATLLEIVRGVDDSAGQLLLIGHSPGLQELAVMLAQPGESLRESMARAFPTAALALLELAVESWGDVRPETARVADFLRPKELSGH